MGKNLKKENWLTMVEENPDIPAEQPPVEPTIPDSELIAAGELAKANGNELFKAGNHKEAAGFYESAVAQLE